ATIWGVLLLGETLHWYEPIGAVVVILGAYLAQRR
ncbi:MAG: EamA family transporter, partial [Actinobacteria bacterium]|nr:EamA family transporter [Actinomycetota bacterium]